uniref:Uncharacterized protein n=1 Tax=Rhizophora mucronata TaxID=61149 RepID=A0A2P2MGJ0_RHIMU
MELGKIEHILPAYLDEGIFLATMLLSIQSHCITPQNNYGKNVAVVIFRQKSFFGLPS